MEKVAPLAYGAHLIPEAAAAWRTLQEAARQAGFVLTMTGGYRSYDEQVNLFHQRFTTDEAQAAPAGKKKEWNGTTYWLKPRMALAARPGTSNHGWGLAVDAALGVYGKGARRVDSDPAFMRWILANAENYGWSWEVQSEPWHLRLIEIPKGFGGASGVKPTGNASQQAGGSRLQKKPSSARSTTQTAPDPVIRYGMEGDGVKALQQICIDWGLANFTNADGRFGTRTQQAVKALQIELNLAPDGEYGPKSAAALRSALAAAATKGAATTTATVTTSGVPAPTLTMGAAGDAVKALQQILIDHRWGSFTIADGQFGAKTNEAVQAMQLDLGVRPDGEYGEKTAAALARFLAKS
jgi:peptidoglycan hydrolase-like protein with peptidoglycan-binding domain